MKPLIIAALLLGTLPVCAQSLSATSSNENLSLARNDRAVSPLFLKSSPDAQSFAMAPGLRMRNAGKGMTIGGIALIVLGTALVASADEHYYTAQQNSYGGSYEEGDPKGAFGIVALTGGIGLTIPGIILWSKGAKKYKAYLEEQNANASSLHFGQRGLSLTYRF